MMSDDGNKDEVDCAHSSSVCDVSYFFDKNPYKSWKRSMFSTIREIPVRDIDKTIVQQNDATADL